MIKEKGVRRDEWVTAEQVAEVMLPIVEEDEVSTLPTGGFNEYASEKIAIKGGTILEVTLHEVREVPLCNNVGPFGKPGATVSNEKELWNETVELLRPGWGNL